MTTKGERIRSLAERRLSAAEFDAYVHAPMSADEREELLSLIRWFKRRYPTVGDRLRAGRRAALRAEKLGRRARG
jgi:hypothetical protein